MIKRTKKSIIKDQLKKLRAAVKRRVGSGKDTSKSAKTQAKVSSTKTNGAQTAAVEPQTLSQSEQQARQYQSRRPFWIQDIPGNYGDNNIFIMVRDPHWIYAYWEIQHDHQQKALQSLGGDWNQVKSVLRVYDCTDGEKNCPFFDITLGDMANHWFVNVNANCSYYIDIGLLHNDGRFVVLARSNKVTTPRSGMSEVLDEHWMGIDFDKLYALSGGFEVGKSSLELRKLMEERLMKAVSSGSGVGAISSIGSPVRWSEKKRGFWFWLDCELIVYGGTEPDAKVTLQGREVKLRPDGTFSFRFALPDGKIVLDAVAQSADGVEERKIVPLVERNTERPEPALLKNE